ncbi:MAG: sigma-54 interaction domain-containing protein, partial [Deferrisomatales bacterium]
PFDVEELLHVVGRVAEKKAMAQEIEDLRRQLQGQRGPVSLIGVSPAIDEVMRFTRKVAAADCNVLLFGESGTGKEVVARAIHAHSRRSDRPFVVADCAALSGSTLGSELFGHVRGAFTGAYADHKGYFESAEGGTLFLDEIGELPLELQGKLLRAVQEQVVVKVGTTRPAKVDVRILAATNRDLPELVARGGFREDLYYRLHVAHLTVPPLRERREDIPLLTHYFLKRFAAQLGLAAAPRLTPETLARLAEQEWPGNVRQLENAVQRAVIMAEGAELASGDFLPALGGGCTAPADADFRAVRRRAAQAFTAQHLAESLRQFQGNVTRAADALGMRRTSLQRLLKQLGLDPRSFRREAPPN